MMSGILMTCTLNASDLKMFDFSGVISKAVSQPRQFLEVHMVFGLKIKFLNISLGIKYEILPYILCL
jgi:hypothetical protein